AGAPKIRPGGAGEDEIGDLGVVVRAGRARGEIGLRAAPLPAARAEIGATKDDGPRGRLVGRVELDLLFAVAGQDGRGCRQRGPGSEHERDPSRHCDPPLPALEHSYARKPVETLANSPAIRPGRSGPRLALGGLSSIWEDRWSTRPEGAAPGGVPDRAERRRADDRDRRYPGAALQGAAPVTDRDRGNLREHICL